MERNGIQNETKFKTIFELQKVTSQTVWEVIYVVFLYLIAQRAVRRAALNALKGWVLDDITLYEHIFFETFEEVFYTFVTQLSSLSYMHFKRLCRPCLP